VTQGLQLNTKLCFLGDVWRGVAWAKRPGTADFSASNPGGECRSSSTYRNVGRAGHYPQAGFQRPRGARISAIPLLLSSLDSTAPNDHRRTPQPARPHLGRLLVRRHRQPLEVMEQITYLLFIKRIDNLQLKVSFGLNYALQVSRRLSDGMPRLSAR
jgi:hypothetical protein